MIDITSDRLLLNVAEELEREERRNQPATHLTRSRISTDTTGFLTWEFGATPTTTSTVSVTWEHAATGISTSTNTLRSLNPQAWVMRRRLTEEDMRWNAFTKVEQVNYASVDVLPGSNQEWELYQEEYYLTRFCVRCGAHLSVINRSIVDPAMCEHCREEAFGPRSIPGEIIGEPISTNESVGWVTTLNVGTITELSIPTLAI